MISKKVRSVEKFSGNFLRALFGSSRYLRISPNIKGKIIFFDKLKKKFFYTYSRNRIDSVTSDQIYTKEDYNLSFLSRYEEILGIYNNILQEGKTPLIIDCGANIGLSACYFADLFPKAKVIAIEPDEENCEMIKKHCSDLKNVSFQKFAIGAEPGFVTIADERADNNAFRTSRNISNSQNLIPVITINEIYSEHLDCMPFLVKIDIEGFEHDLFSSNIEWFSKTPLVIIETHDWMLPKESNSRSFLKAASTHDRDFIHKGENIFSILN